MAIPVIKKMKITELNKIKDRTKKELARKEIAEYLEDTVLDYVSEGKSPVAGERTFKPLTKKYIKIKSKISGSTKPNMELYGDMLDDFAVKNSGNEFSIGIHSDASEESKLKAERHNHWTKRAPKIKGSSKIYPKRRFIPKGDQKFKKEIMDDIKDIIDTYTDEDAS